jgi:hypothetical protein
MRGTIDKYLYIFWRYVSLCIACFLLECGLVFHIELEWRDRSELRGLVCKARRSFVICCVNPVVFLNVLDKTGLCEGPEAAVLSVMLPRYSGLDLEKYT